MGFRDSKQRARVCHTLMKLVRQEKLFILPVDLGDSFGPTDYAENVFDAILCNKSSLSTGEQTMLSVAFFFWRGSGRVRIGQVMRLERTLVEAIGELMVVSSGRDSVFIDEWIVKWEHFDPIADYFAS